MDSESVVDSCDLVRSEQFSNDFLVKEPFNRDFLRSECLSDSVSSSDSSSIFSSFS